MRADATCSQRRLSRFNQRKWRRRRLNTRSCSTEVAHGDQLGGSATVHLHGTDDHKRETHRVTSPQREVLVRIPVKHRKQFSSFGNSPSNFSALFSAEFSLCCLCARVRFELLSAGWWACWDWPRQWLDGCESKKVKALTQLGERWHLARSSAGCRFTVVCRAETVPAAWAGSWFEEGKDVLQDFIHFDLLSVLRRSLIKQKRLLFQTPEGLENVENVTKSK